PQVPRERVSGRDHTAAEAALHDVAAEPALHGGHAGARACSDCRRSSRLCDGRKQFHHIGAPHALAGKAGGRAESVKVGRCEGGKAGKWEGGKAGRFWIWIGDWKIDGF